MQTVALLSSANKNGPDSSGTHFYTRGGWEIRTPEGITTLPPFQDGALDRYANPPSPYT